MIKFEQVAKMFNFAFISERKFFLLCEPTHPNLGDQAQLMCTEYWIKNNYPTCKLVKIGTMYYPLDNSIKSHLNIKRLFKYLLLKLSVKKNDIFVGHSGYFFVDHHVGWFTFSFILDHFPNNKMIILPQTINFYAPVVKAMVCDKFNKKKNLTILCRDEVSYGNAKKLFPCTRLLLYPDIVTSLIGSSHYDFPREGILFCIRDDIETFYKIEDITELMNRFGHIRKEKIDTTIKVPIDYLTKNRDELINEMIAKIATFKVVITDRYHGTIFSAIASTPVIVIASADHKLSSGVKWFPNEVFKDYVQYAEDLNDAYNKAEVLLSRDDLKYNNPSYFKEKYWDLLKSRL